MPKLYFTVGAATSESIDTNQLVWTLLPETTIPAVTATRARQVYPGIKVLFQLGSVKNFFNHHYWPQLNGAGGSSIELAHAEFAALREQLDAFSGDEHKRARIIVSFLSAHRSLRPKLYPILDWVSQKRPLTRKEIAPLVDALLAVLSRESGPLFALKQKLIHFIKTGTYNIETVLWLAIAVDPRFALHIWYDDLREEIQQESDNSDHDRASLEKELRQAIEQIRSGQISPKEVGGVDLQSWLVALIGCAPQQRFFAEAGKSKQGLNHHGCLRFVRVQRFQDFGETATRLISLDKLSRAVTAFDRTLSHLVIRFCLDDPEMKDLTQNYQVHSGLLTRALVGDCEAMRILYPSQTMMIPDQTLSERLIEKTQEAVNDGSLAHLCSQHYAIPEEQLQRGIERLLTVHRKMLPLVPVEVHHLANAIENRIRLSKIAESLEANGGRVTHPQQMRQLIAAIRVERERQTDLARTLKADFHIDPSKLFYIDNLLIDRSKALFGNDLEFMRTILAGYIERHNAAHPRNSNDSAING